MVDVTSGEGFLVITFIEDAMFRLDFLLVTCTQSAGVKFIISISVFVKATKVT